MQTIKLLALWRVKTHHHVPQIVRIRQMRRIPKKKSELKPLIRQQKSGLTRHLYLDWVPHREAFRMITGTVLTAYHCTNARVSSPPSKPAGSSRASRFASPPPPAARSKRARLLWRILINRLSTGPFARASCPSCLCRTGSVCRVALAELVPFL